MRHFFRGGRELPKGQGDTPSQISRHYDRNVMERSNPKELIEDNHINRLLRLRLLADPRNDGGMIVGLSAYNLWPKAFLIIFCVLFSGLLVSPALGQEADGLNKVQPLTIGSKVPNEFWTHQHLFYINGDTVRQSLEEHKGKLLVLDFWMSGCTTCLRHQKEINVFKKSYAEKLAVVMVNSKKTKENFEKIDWAVRSDRYKQLGIERLESIIEDTYLERLFPYHCFPSYFWINENGVLQTHTFRNLLDNGYQAPYIEK